MKKNDNKRLVRVRMGDIGRYIEEADTLNQFKINIIKEFKVNSNENDYILSCEDKAHHTTNIEDEETYQKIKHLLIKYPKLIEPSFIPRKKIIHIDSKCFVCEKSPIEGIRYVCMNCNLYELCSDCEKTNGERHGHPLLKLRKENYLEKYKDIIFNNYQSKEECKDIELSK